MGFPLQQPVLSFWLVWGLFLSGKMKISPPFRAALVIVVGACVATLLLQFIQPSRPFPVIRDFAVKQGLAGGVVAYADKGKPLKLQAFGYAGAGRKITTDDRFKIASLSKPVTAAAITALVHQGKLSLETKLVDNVPEAARFPAVAALYQELVINVGRQAIAGLIQEGVKEGVLRNVPAEAAIRAIIGPVLAHMLLTHVFNQGREKTNQKDVAALAAALADLLLNGLAVKAQEPGS